MPENKPRAPTARDKETQVRQVRALAEDIVRSPNFARRI